MSAPPKEGDPCRAIPEGHRFYGGEECAACDIRRPLTELTQAELIALLESSRRYAGVLTEAIRDICFDARRRAKNLGLVE